jgi:hypothetical protein
MNERERVSVPAEARARFRRLEEAPAIKSGAEAAPDWSIVDSVVLDAIRPVDHWLESGWLGHIPFMYSVIGMLRPRRFAELGSHHGASFFAACQAVRELDVACECVAVDHWKGDSQAGAFTEGVFSGFNAIRQREFDDFATYVRADFDSAAASFEAGSIDLLHIDGFHSYEAISHDFDTWFPKLSSRGAVLFHDVNEHQATFGVWRFWREIEERFPGQTLFFGQSHGLGVLNLDDDQAAPLASLMAECRDRGRLRFIQQYFTALSELNATYQGRVTDAGLRGVQATAQLVSESAESASRLAVLQRERETEIAQLQAAHSAQVAQLAQERLVEIGQLQEAHQLEIEQLQDANEEELADLAADFGLRAAELESLEYRKRGAEQVESERRVAHIDSQLREQERVHREDLEVVEAGVELEVRSKSSPMMPPSSLTSGGTGGSARTRLRRPWTLSVTT